MRLLCYLCPEALFQSVPFLRELAPPCTFCEWRSRDGEIPVKADGTWSSGGLWVTVARIVITVITVAHSHFYGGRLYACRM